MTDVYKKDRKKEKNWNYTRGGDGSHWEGCEETHWDCKIVHLEKENQRMVDVVSAAVLWRMTEVDMEDNYLATEGENGKICDCHKCVLIRAVDKYARSG
jgi:hypothetical protein